MHHGWCMRCVEKHAEKSDCSQSCVPSAVWRCVARRVWCARNMERQRNASYLPTVSSDERVKREEKYIGWRKAQARPAGAWSLFCRRDEEKTVPEHCSYKVDYSQQSTAVVGRGWECGAATVFRHFGALRPAGRACWSERQRRRMSFVTQGKNVIC